MVNSATVGTPYQSAFVTGTTGTIGYTGNNSMFSSSQMKFATNGSAFFTGALSPNDGQFTLPNVSSLAPMVVANGDQFTVEMWLYPTMKTSYTGSVGPSNSGSPALGIYDQVIFCSNTLTTMGFYVYLENNFNVTCYGAFPNSTTYGTYSTQTILSGGTWTLNSWNHIAISYSPIYNASTNPLGGWRLWVNGFLSNKYTTVYNLTNIVNAPPTGNWMQEWVLGSFFQNKVSTGVGPYWMGLNNGYMQQFRVSNIVRYSTSTDTVGERYTQPTAAFVPDANTVYLNSLDQASGTNLALSQLTPGPTGTISTTATANISPTGNIAVNAITLSSDLYLKSNYAPPQPGSIGYYVEILPTVPIILTSNGIPSTIPFSLPLGGYLIQYNAHFGNSSGVATSYLSTCISTTTGDFLTTAIRQSVYSTIASQTIGVTELSSKPNASGSCFYYNSTSNPLTLFFNLRASASMQCQYLTINYVRIC